jgi:MFS family permease
MAADRAARMPAPQPVPLVDQIARRRWLIFGVLSAAAFMAQLDLFIVNIALPALGRSFPRVGLNNLSWVLNAYSIALATLLVPSGRLADQFGRRRFFLGGVVVFTAASIMCAMAPSLLVIVVGRTLQGVGSAMLIPTSLGLLFPSFPKEKHSLSIASSSEYGPVWRPSQHPPGLPSVACWSPWIGG